MTTNTDTLVAHAVNIIKNGKDNVTISKITPSHLTYDIRRIAHIWETTGVVIPSDLEYLIHIHANTDAYLKEHTYLLGKWYAYKSYKHTNHNIGSYSHQKRVERAKRQYKLLQHTQTR